VALISGFMALLSFLFFTVLPIAIVAWLVVKVYKHLRNSGDKPAYE
jgi:hypothetical protein